VAQIASGVPDVTLTCTSMPRWSDGNPMKVPWSGIAWCGSHTTATVTRPILPTLPLVGSKSVQPSLLRLPWLAPDITTAIVNGRKPPQLTAQTLMRLTSRLPAGWAEQQSSSAFAENKSSILRVPASNPFGFA
jgi:hypothetical protein